MAAHVTLRAGLAKCRRGTVGFVILGRALVRFGLESTPKSLEKFLFLVNREKN